VSRPLSARLRGRMRSVFELIAHFSHRERFFFIPLLLILLLGGVLLALTSGLGYVAPFVYSIF
jgi:hypothetical protein